MLTNMILLVILVTLALMMIWLVSSLTSMKPIVYANQL